jgi:DNA polymerase-1
VFVVVSGTPHEAFVQRFDDSGVQLTDLEPVDVIEAVTTIEPTRPRWVWDDTHKWYPRLLRAGLRVDRCVDLRLCHAILKNSAFTARSALARAVRGPWDDPGEWASSLDSLDSLEAREWLGGNALFDLDDGVEPERLDPLAEWSSQREAVAGSAEPGRLNLLLSAESAGALIACEIAFAGLPVDASVHERLLAGLLGDRPINGARPAKLEALVSEMQGALDSDRFNPDSPTELLKALRAAGLQVASTRSWELKRIDHPVIAPLLEYKKLSRLMTANGWSWLDTWVKDGRFRPDYVPGGVVTGRWAASGGGALQLPRQVRGAVVADPGWKLVVADASQLEPRILTALSGDRRMAEAGHGDLYAGIVDSGAVRSRAEAKVAMLGAMYGATTGESGRLLPGLSRAFPQALAFVESAARAGERGEVVSTRLGRTSPRPSTEWLDVQRDSALSNEAEKRARSAARSWGRFTRNFVVQGTAAEWALCWMAGLRQRLSHLAKPAPESGFAGDGRADAPLPDAGITAAPHLVFFLHDEVIVHTPEAMANDVLAAVHAAADDAGRLLFGATPVIFPVTAAIVEVYADAK